MHLSVRQWQQQVNEHMSGMGMEPKLADGGYEEAAVLKIQNQSLHWSPGTLFSAAS